MTKQNNLDDHPTVIKVRQQRDRGAARPAEPLDASWLRELCLDAGADDVGFVEIDRPEIADQRADLGAALPGVRTLISFVCRMNRENIRTPARSVANLEFHHSGDHTNEVGRQVVAKLEAMGVRALNPAMGFPMEMDKFPRKTWVVGHKPVAVAAGLGKMGIHRNVIHPKFGNFVLLGTVLIDAEVSDRSRPLEFNPCVECKLCVTACPTGAIAADGHFDFSACYTHNYREFMGGFGDWAEQVADSRDADDYRSRVSDSESASMWQSLSFGANYKAANCMSVCPAGEDVLGPWLDDRKAHLTDVVRPLLDKEETIYVVPGSDAEQYVANRFPHKRTKRVGQSLRANSIDGLVEGMPLLFQREQAKGLSATYHFTFTGAESRQITVTIRDRELDIAEGHHGAPDLRITADSRTWLRFLTKQSVLPWALLSGRIKMHGPPRLLRAFGRCFPSQSVRKQRAVESSPRNGRAITSAHRAKVERDLVLERKETVAEGVVLLTLRDPEDRPLPEWQPGAHIDLMLRADLVRQYSLCGDPADRSRLQVAVLREPESRGGSSYVHDVLSEGESVRIRGPRNNFPLVKAKRYLFIVGGIGITPILPMVAAVDARGADWRLVYGGRTRASMAFRETLQRAYGERVSLRPQDEFGLLDLPSLLGRPQRRTAVYTCGPEPLLAAVESGCEKWPSGALHVERFAAKKDATDGPRTTFEVELAQSGRTLLVPEDMSVLEAVEDAGVSMMSSCGEGICGTCETTVLSGQIDHRDSVLNDRQRAAGDTMMICVSRAGGDRLVLDL